jgi:hypothetical protein
MKKNSLRKLTVTRETLCLLQNRELNGVEGGVTGRVQCSLASCPTCVTCDTCNVTCSDSVRICCV